MTTNPEEGIKVSAPDEGEEVPGLTPIAATNGEKTVKENGHAATSESLVQ